MSEALELTPRQVGFLHDRLMALNALRDTNQMANLLAALSAMGKDGEKVVKEHMADLRAGAGIELTSGTAGYTEDNT